MSHSTLLISKKNRNLDNRTRTLATDFFVHNMLIDKFPILPIHFHTTRKSSKSEVFKRTKLWAMNQNSKKLHEVNALSDSVSYSALPALQSLIDNQQLLLEAINTEVVGTIFLWFQDSGGSFEPGKNYVFQITLHAIQVSLTALNESSEHTKCFLIQIHQWGQSTVFSSIHSGNQCSLPCHAVVTNCLPTDGNERLLTDIATDHVQGGKCIVLHARMWKSCQFSTKKQQHDAILLTQQIHSWH